MWGVRKKGYFNVLIDCGCCLLCWIYYFNVLSVKINLLILGVL